MYILNFLKIKLTKGVSIHRMNTIYQKHLKTFVLVILMLVVLNQSLLAPSYSGFSSTSFNTTYFLEQELSSDTISIQPLARTRIIYDNIYKIIGLFSVLWILAFILMQNHRGILYEHHHISRLFIRLQRLLLPKQNTSKFKSSLLLT